ncbi:MAG: N-acetylmuramoyl-L-alanine amidase family protein [Bacillota bacterium]
MRSSFLQGVSSRLVAVILTLLLVCLCTGGAVCAASSSDVNLVINGEVASSDVGPLIVPPGRTLVPIRLVSESLGWRVDWFPITRQVLITGQSDDEHVLLGIDDPVAFVHGQKYTMGVPPLIIDGRTLVPIRLVAEAFGGEVGWDGDTRTVTVASLSGVDAEPEPEDDDEPEPDEPEDIPHLGEGKLEKISLVDTDSDYGLRLAVSGSFDVEVLRESEDRLTLYLGGLTAPDDLLGTTNFPQDSPISLVRLRPSAVDDELYVTVDFRHPVVYELNAGESGFFLHLARIQDIRAGADGRLTVLTNIDIKPRVFALRDPARVVMDFHGAVIDQYLDGARVNSGDIERYRIGRHRQALGDTFDGVRIVLDLKDDLVPSVSSEVVDGTHEVTVGLTRFSVSGRLVVIDPGHGGKDPGAIGVSGTKEKVINLEVALRVASLLRDAGVELVLTRTGDEDVYIYDRPEMANALRADAFVSIHCNADPKGRAEGTETYYHSNHSNSMHLAEVIHAQVVNAVGRPDRGVRFANFAVLRETDMPSALVEILYMSSAQDERMLLNPSVQQRVAEAIVMALEQFFTLY